MPNLSHTLVRCLAIVAVATLCIDGSTVLPAGGNLAAMPLNSLPANAMAQGQHTPEFAAKNDFGDQISYVSESREDSSESAHEPLKATIQQTRSLSDASFPQQPVVEAPKPEEPKQDQPVGLKQIWRQLSGIGKAASPSPARTSAPALPEPATAPTDAPKVEEPKNDNGPLGLKQIWRQLSGIGKALSPSPGRTSQAPALRAPADAEEAPRGKSLSRSVDPEPAFVPPAPVLAASAPAVSKPAPAPAAAVKSAVAQEAPALFVPPEADEVTEADLNGTFAVNVYSAEEANTVRWAPLKFDDAVVVPVYFKPHSKHKLFTNQTVDVTLVGSWSAWADHYKLTKKTDEEWDGVVNIPVGKHLFKFIIDGEWTTSPQWPLEEDGDGNLNNVIDIPEPTKGMLLREKKSIFSFMSRKKQATILTPAGEAPAPKPDRKKGLSFFGF